MERGKNRAIEFFRFFFCCGIFFFHFGALHAPETAFWPFAGGYLGVEFFFLVAGWLMMPRLLRLPRGRAGLRPALELFAGRVRRLYPPYLISLLALLAARKLLYPAYGLLPALRGGLPDLLLLQVFRGNWTMEILYWFVSALLWAGLLLSLLALGFGAERYARRAAPALFLAFLLWSAAAHGFLNAVEPERLWIGGARALAELGLGCTLYTLPPRRLPPRLAAALELLSLAAVLALMARSGGWGDYLCLLLLALLTWLLFTRQGLLSRLLDQPLCEALGALSYGMYLNQPLVLLLLRPLSGRLGLWPGALLELLALIALSRAENLLLDRLSRRERARDGSRT